jgi:predicted  nucleic acid-binding Zn-ribbon protein
LEQQDQQMRLSLENARTAWQEVQKQCNLVNAKRTQEADVICGKENKLQGDLGELLSERLRFSADLDARMLARYDRVRGARSGLGIVPAIAGRCNGCNMVVPPQVYNEIVACISLHACPSCHRILFVP